MKKNPKISRKPSHNQGGEKKKKNDSPVISAAQLCVERLGPKTEESGPEDRGPKTQDRRPLFAVRSVWQRPDLRLLLWLSLKSLLLFVAL